MCVIKVFNHLIIVFFHTTFIYVFRYTAFSSFSLTRHRCVHTEWHRYALNLVFICNGIYKCKRLFSDLMLLSATVSE